MPFSTFQNPEKKNYLQRSVCVDKAIRPILDGLRRLLEGLHSPNLLRNQREPQRHH